jgi:hypothetical protein
MNTHSSLFRLALTATAFALLALGARAQEDPPPDEQPALKATTYDLSGLLENGALYKLADMLAPDRTFTNTLDPTEEGVWAVRNCRGGSRCFASVDDAINSILAFCNTGLEAQYARDAANPAAITLTCDELLHQRVAWALDTLKSAAAARVRLRAYALGTSATPCTLGKVDAAGLAKGANLIGSVEGQLGETLLLQQVRPHEFVQSYAAAEGGAAPVRAMVCSGQEVLSGVLLLPDGRVWLQAWAARLQDLSSREVVSRNGKLECPRGVYAYATLGALLENGGGSVLDLGAQRVLVICSVDGAMPNRTLECGTRTTLGLVNAAGAVKAQLPGIPWMSAPAIGETRLGRSVSDDESWPESSVAAEASIALANRLAYEGEVLGAIVALGPYLGVRITEPAGEGSVDDFESARKNVATVLKSLSAGPRPLEFSIRAWRVKSVPERIADGTAGIKEMAALGAPFFERTSAGLPGQFNYVADIEAAALVVGDGGVPDLGVACWGTQCEWRVIPGAGGLEIELRLGHVEGERTVKLGMGGKAEFERANRAPAQAELSGAVGEGALRCTVVPALEGFLVVAVQRLK